MLLSAYYLKVSVTNLATCMHASLASLMVEPKAGLIAIFLSPCMMPCWTFPQMHMAQWQWCLLPMSPDKLGFCFRLCLTLMRSAAALLAAASCVY
jgi:hypothetical protein